MTKLSLIIYKKEIHLTTNTAEVALKSLTNSQYFYRGLLGQELDRHFIDKENYHPLFLFPDEDAIELTSDYLKSIKKPINLIVPDGTWRQAKKIFRRTPEFTGIQKVKINPPSKSIYPFRRQKFDQGLCTFEAIAHAFGALEGPEIKMHLMNNFDIFVSAHLKNREAFKDFIN